MASPWYHYAYIHYVLLVLNCDNSVTLALSSCSIPHLHVYIAELEVPGKIACKAFLHPNAVSDELFKEKGNKVVNLQLSIHWTKLCTLVHFVTHTNK